MHIPDTIIETRAELKRAIIDSDERAERHLLTRAKASLDWLIEHLLATDAAYRMARAETGSPRAEARSPRAEVEP